MLLRSSAFSVTEWRSSQRRRADSRHHTTTSKRRTVLDEGHTTPVSFRSSTSSTCTCTCVSCDVLLPARRGFTNLEPGPSALRWLLGDDAADRAWGRVKITSQLIGYFEGKAVLPRIYFRTAGGHRAVAKLSLGRAGLKFESFRQTVASCEHVATRLAPRKHNCCSSFSATTQTCEKKRQDRWGSVA